MRRGEDGTVLLSTLLVLSLISAVSLALLATLRSSIDTARQLSEASQADLYAAGAESFARAQIGALARLEGPQLNAALLNGGPVLLPFENGSIAASLRDGTHCLRLSGLTDTSGTVQDDEVIRLATLFDILQIPDGTRLAAAAADWADADSQQRPSGAEDGSYLLRTPAHRTANVPFSSVSELRAVDGMTEDIFQTVRPHLCIGAPGVPTRFNVDTADVRHLPVLAALLADGDDAQLDPLTKAQTLLGSRPPGGFGSAESYASALGLDTGVDSGSDSDLGGGVGLPDAIVFAPDRVEVEAVVRFGEAERAQLYAYEGLDGEGEGGGRLRLTYRDWGRAAFRPVVIAEPEGG